MRHAGYQMRSPLCLSHESSKKGLLGAVPARKGSLMTLFDLGSAESSSRRQLFRPMFQLDRLWNDSIFMAGMNSSQGEAHAPVGASSSASAKRRILLIEDDSRTRLVLWDKLREAGFE